MRKIYYFLFVFIPLIGLFLMGVFLDAEKIESPRERRTLAEKPKSIWKETQKLESYLSDHLPLRDKMLDWYFGLGLSFDFGTEKIIIGKNDWLFLKKHDTTYNLPVMESYQNKVLFSDKQHMKIIENLMHIKRQCDTHNIRLYLLFPPSKDRIYAQYMPSYILRDKRPSPVKQLVNLLPTELNVVPIEDLLIREARISKEPLYFKQDSHWAEEGAFIVYQQLMQYIQKDFPDLKAKAKDDFKIEKINDVFSPYFNLKSGTVFGKGSFLLPGMDQYNTLKYNHYTYKDIENVTIKKSSVFISSIYPQGFPLKVYIIGDSFATYLHPYLSATFQYVHAHRFNPMGEGNWGIHFNERMKEMIEDGTNILIISVSDLKLKDLLEPFK